MSNQPSATVVFSYTKPIPWRIIDAGLCLEGRCLTQNSICNAYTQMVIGNLGMGQFIISSMDTFKCPVCRNDVRALKFGLNRCRWRIMNTNKWSNVGDVYQKYDLSLTPIHIETRNLKNEDYNSKEDCTICLSSMDKQSSKCSILPCKHIFHTECIHGWIDAEEETSLQCPVCRRPIFE